jgi:hypothetical protein
MNVTIKDFIIGEKVLCNGEADYIIDFIKPNDEENYKMGYRIVLKENGTQSINSITKLNKQLN